MVSENLESQYDLSKLLVDIMKLEVSFIISRPFIVNLKSSFKYDTILILP